MVLKGLSPLTKRNKLMLYQLYQLYQATLPGAMDAKGLIFRIGARGTSELLIISIDSVSTS